MVKYKATMRFLLGFLVGMCLGNFLPDPTDWYYFSCVANGSILDPNVSVFAYYIFPAIFWGSVFAIVNFMYENDWIGVRETVWLISIIIIGSTVGLILTVSPLMPELSLVFDTMVSVACIFSILYVEGRLGDTLKRFRNKL